MASWRWIPGFIGEHEVSCEGEVRSWKIGRSKTSRSSKISTVLRPGPDRKGYLGVCLGSRSDGTRRTYKVHYLVLMAFVGPKPQGHEAGHLDGNNRNNSVHNLKWITAKENTAHKWAHKTMVTSLNKDAVLEIRRRASGGVRQATLAKEFLISPANVSLIVNRKAWGHI